MLGFSCIVPDRNEERETGVPDKSSGIIRELERSSSERRSGDDTT